MFKNVSGQKLIVFAFDSTTNLPKTGDAANITAYISKDYGAVTALTDTSATEMDATNAQGYYMFDLTQTESNADTIHSTAKSSTADIVVIAVPAVVYTLPATGILAPTTAGRTLDVSAGGEAGIDLANVGSPTTTLNLSGLTIKNTTDINTLLGTPAGASVSADVAAVKTQTAAIEVDTADIQTQVGTAGAGLTALGDTRLANLDATVSSRLATAGYTAPPSAASNATAVRSELTTELARIDVGVSTRLASASYTAPDNASITAILDDTGTTIPATLSAIAGYIDTEIGTLQTSVDDIPTNAELTAALSGVALEATAQSIKAKTDSLTFTVAGQVDANAESANGAEILGNGTASNLWRGE